MINHFTTNHKKEANITKEMLQEADNFSNVWYDSSKEKQNITLYVKPEISDYITETPLHNTQEIIEIHEDGGLMVHCEITHEMEILPQIKSLLPHIVIREPKKLAERLSLEISGYLEELELYS